MRDKVVELDPNFERAAKVSQIIQSACSTYKEFLKANRVEFEKKQKQKSMTDFFSKPK